MCVGGLIYEKEVKAGTEPLEGLFVLQIEKLKKMATVEWLKKKKTFKFFLFFNIINLYILNCDLRVFD